MGANLDMDCLRTFVAIVDAGNFAAAAERVRRTASAVSLQIKRLEGQVGCRLFRRAGRRMVLSDEGERLLHSARRILALNDQILESLAHRNLTGEISFGAIQDFADTLLPGILGRLKRAHPNLRIRVRVDRTKTLADAVEKGDLDLAIGVHGRSSGPRRTLRREPMVWWGRADVEPTEGGPVPLVVFEPPCSFRDAAIDSLETAGREWEIVYTSPSLSGLRAAVQAGLGVTARAKTSFFGELNDLIAVTSLPPLPPVEFALYEQPNPSAAAGRLRRIIVDEVAWDVTPS